MIGCLTETMCSGEATSEIIVNIIYEEDITGNCSGEATSKNYC